MSVVRKRLLNTHTLGVKGSGFRVREAFDADLFPVRRCVMYTRKTHSPENPTPLRTQKKFIKKEKKNISTEYFLGRPKNGICRRDLAAEFSGKEKTRGEKREEEEEEEKEEEEEEKKTKEEQEKKLKETFRGVAPRRVEK